MKRYRYFVKDSNGNCFYRYYYFNNDVEAIAYKDTLNKTNLFVLSIETNILDDSECMISIWNI